MTASVCREARLRTIADPIVNAIPLIRRYSSSDCLVGFGQVEGANPGGRSFSSGRFALLGRSDEIRRGPASAIGTELPIRDVRASVAIGGKADLTKANQLG
jgi:hypothetical protein